MHAFFTWLSSFSPETYAAAMTYVNMLIWVLTGIVLLAVLARSFRGARQKTVTRSYRIFFFVLAALFAAVLAYQATWQLAGFARPEFVKFMKRYNRRPDNPAALMMRGRILDRHGEALAQMDPDRPGKRWYPIAAAGAHIVGYENAYYGLFGIEAAENAVLSGISTGSEDERQQFRKNLLRREELRGNDVQLTLDQSLQREAHTLMKGRRGAVVAMDPSSGALLVVYSSPGFDPNNLQPELFEQRDKEARMMNRALQGLYPAGSTFKVLVAAAALELGMNPRYDCPAEGYRAGNANRPIRDHEYYDFQRRGQVWRGHGTINMRDALAKSSNIYFARLGVDIGGDRLREAVMAFGFDRSWTIHEGASGSLASLAGRFPDLDKKDMAKTAQISIGQGEMLVTPLHMAIMAAAIGRQGAWWSPRLVASSPPKPLDPCMSPDTARTLAGMMRFAVTHGSGSGANIDGLSVAGKTGTAQNPRGEDHSWFIGFAPSDHARLAFAVIIEHGGYGSEAAVPVAAGLLRKAQANGYFDVAKPSSPPREER